MCAKPVVITNDQKLNIGDEVLASSLYSVFDAEGDSITKVRFRDVNGALNEGGAFYVDGTQITNSNFFEVDAADLFKVFFHAAAGFFTEAIEVQVYDGSAWSNVGSIDVYTGTPNTLGPSLTVTRSSVIENEILDLHSIIAYSDPNNDPVVRYKAKDNRDNTGTASGYFVKNGVRQLQKEWFYFTASDNVHYVAAPGQYEEGIQVRAFDGIYWTDPVNSSIKTFRNANRPVAGSLDARVKANVKTKITELFEAYDEDPNTLKTYSFRDTHNLGGSLMFGDTVITPKTWLTVTAAQLDNVYFVGAESTFTEQLFVQVNDGKYNSNIGSVLLETIAVPVLEVRSQLMDDLTNTRVAPNVTKVDRGPAHTNYEVIFTADEGSTGYFQLFGQRLQDEVLYEFTSAEFNALEYRSGRYELPSLNNMLVRASNDTFWSDWERVDFRTEAEHLSSLLINYLSGNSLSWEQFLPTRNPVEITYSFFNVYETGYEGDDVNANNFIGFDVQERAAAREWLAEIETFANVEFTEVAADSISPYGHLGGVIRFGCFFLEDTDYAAFAYLPDDPAANALGGDIWVNHWATSGFQEGQFGYFVLGHELGHAMGLKHPHEAPATLPNITDNQWHSVMSYNQDRTWARDYGLYDVYALQELYGANTDYNAGDDVYTFGPQIRTQMRTIWDAGGNDTMDMSAFNRVIHADIRDGALTQVLGSSPFTDDQTGNPLDSDNFNVAFGTDIENFIGGSNSDIIIGNNLDNVLEGRSGNDWIQGLGGDDLLMAGAGDDTYIWGLADGRDVIDEQKMAGRDMLIIESALAGIDNLTEDLSFSRLNARDLLIDLTLDGGDSIGSIYINYQQGSSRIETLRLQGYNGSDLDIDLTTFIASLDSNPTGMIMTGNTTIFGNEIVAAS